MKSTCEHAWKLRDYRLVPTHRYYPLHFQILSSLIRLGAQSDTYIPLASPILDPLASSLYTSPARGSKSDSSSLKPLDFAYYLKAPNAYLKSRFYASLVLQEVSFLLVDYLKHFSAKISFPEMTLPVIHQLKRLIKTTSGPLGKEMSVSLKPIVERLVESNKIIEQKRGKLEFTPQDREEIDRFEAETMKGVQLPIQSYAKLLLKNREQRKALLEREAGQADEDGSAGEEEENEGEEDEEMNLDAEE